MANEVRIVIYHYMNGGTALSTPNAEIAIRRNQIGDITVETITDGITEMSILEIG